MKPVILLRYGEISLKGKNRRFFESTLMNNIRLASSSFTHTQLQLRYGRIYMPHAETDILDPLKKVFGLVGFAKAYQLAIDAPLETIQATAATLAEQALQNTDQTFCIDTRRPNKRYAHDSLFMNQQLGGAILQRFPHLKVKLEQPDLCVSVEIRDEGIFLYTNRENDAGPGGLPVGVSGYGLLMLSGGIDSPVAGWMMMKRGMPLDAIHFHSFPYTGEKAKDKALDLAHMLAAWKLQPIRVYIPYFTNIQVQINKVCREDYWTILHRRFMLRISQKIAANRALNQDRQYKAFVTGESLGQVASQTIDNIAVINKISALPIIRPLIGFDKHEIIQLAEKIGTFRISKKPHEDCCTVFAPRRPHTKAREYDVLQQESQLDVDALVEESLNKMEVITAGDRA